MASKLRGLVSNLHNRVRIDEFSWIKPQNAFAVVRPMQNKLIKEETDNFAKFKEQIRPEFEKFFDRLNARTIPITEPLSEPAGGFNYSTVTSPYFQLFRAHEGRPQAVFSLKDLPQLRSASDKKLGDIATPIIRLNDDHTKLVFIVRSS